MLRKRYVVALVALVLVGIAFFAVPLWGTRLTEIDVSSGRVRERVLVLGITVRQTARDTAFSRLVSKYVHDIPSPNYKPAFVGDVGLKRLWAEWVWGREFMCYRYGSAMGPMRMLPELLEAAHLGSDREAEIVTRMLTALREKRFPDMGQCVADVLAVLESQDGESGGLSRD